MNIEWARRLLEFCNRREAEIMAKGWPCSIMDGGSLMAIWKGQSRAHEAIEAHEFRERWPTVTAMNLHSWR